MKIESVSGNKIYLRSMESIGIKIIFPNECRKINCSVWTLLRRKHKKNQWTFFCRRKYAKVEKNTANNSSLSGSKEKIPISISLWNLKGNFIFPIKEFKAALLLSMVCYILLN